MSTQQGQTTWLVCPAQLARTDMHGREVQTSWPAARAHFPSAAKLSSQPSCKTHAASTSSHTQAAHLTCNRMCQDPNKPAYLRNDKNEFLNYTDDWYVLGFKPDKYVVIYYKGNNDAWKGYGGVTVYTRDWRMNNDYTEDISKAMDKVGAGAAACSQSRVAAMCHALQHAHSLLFGILHQF